MTDPDSAPADPEPTATTTNTAQEGSTVGIQASVVHNSTVIISPELATPEQLFRAGKKYFAIGATSKARQLIGEAIAGGCNTTEARFYFLLALMSKRSDRDLTPEEHEQLRRASTSTVNGVDDPWGQGLRVVIALLDHADDPSSDRDTLLDQLGGLPDSLQAAIIQHLDVVLTGVMSENLWNKVHSAAKVDQFANDRTNRVWAYFHPDPAPPLVRAPTAERPTVGAWLRTFLAIAVFAVAAGRVTATALERDAFPTTLAIAIGVAAYGVSWYAGREWEFRATQLAAAERAHAFGRSLRMPDDLFTRLVGYRFNYYSIKYAPKGVDIDHWLNDTAGIRSSLRDEVAELYRGAYGIPRVNWLVRHLVRDLRTHWTNGTLRDYRERYRTPSLLKALVVASVASTVVAGFVVAAHAAELDPLGSALTAAVAAFAGLAATACSVQIANDLRRRAEETRRHARESAVRIGEYERWRKRLVDTRPTEIEMERWLEADRKVFLGRSLATYHLAWRDLFSRAALQSRATRYVRARREDGPWRYSRYELTLFLITREGVREVRTVVDFTKGEFGVEERSNYRFDAVSSVQITTRPDSSADLAVTLTNGDPREFRIVDTVPAEAVAIVASNPTTEHLEPDADTSGFAHALHVLEGMAAEGRKWLEHRALGRRGATESGSMRRDGEHGTARPVDTETDAA